MKDFISIADFTGEQLAGLLDRAAAEKKRFKAGDLPPTCQRKTLAMIFEKPSLRTRVSFQCAITQLGGAAIYLTDQDIGLGKRESVADVGRVLGGMCDAVAVRTFDQAHVTCLGEHCAAPVINALTDRAHPCQAMADIMTAREVFGDLAGRTIAFVGDGNNVARSLAVLCAKLGIAFVLACPAGYELDADQAAGGLVQVRDPHQAVRDAAVVYTDTWVSMGQQDQRARRVEAFSPFQVNEALMASAPADAVVMHCLPAYRGYEISDGVLAAHAETIFAQAENRLHFQRALLNVLIAAGGIE